MTTFFNNKQSLYSSFAISGEFGKAGISGNNEYSVKTLFSNSIEFDDGSIIY